MVVLVRVMAVPVVWVTAGVKVPPVRTVSLMGQLVAHRVLLLFL